MNKKEKMRQFSGAILEILGSNKEHAKAVGDTMVEAGYLLLSMAKSGPSSQGQAQPSKAPAPPPPPKAVRSPFGKSYAGFNVDRRIVDHVLRHLTVHKYATASELLKRSASRDFPNLSDNSVRRALYLICQEGNAEFVGPPAKPRMAFRLTAAGANAKAARAKAPQQQQPQALMARVADLEKALKESTATTERAMEIANKAIEEKEKTNALLGQITGSALKNGHASPSQVPFQGAQNAAKKEDPAA